MSAFTKWLPCCDLFHRIDSNVYALENCKLTFVDSGQWDGMYQSYQTTGTNGTFIVVLDSDDKFSVYDSKQEYLKNISCDEIDKLEDLVGV